MKYALTILLFFAGFFVQAEDLKMGGFFSLDFGISVNNKLSKIYYPLFLSYGGNILEDQYVGQAEIGVGLYSLPFHLSFKYNYDFMHRSSDWGVGVDTALYVGGEAVEYAVGQKSGVSEEESKGLSLLIGSGDEKKDGINMYVGHDLGLFVKKRISKSFVVLFRGGINNALAIKPRFVTTDEASAEVESNQESKKDDEEIEINSEFLNPNFYLSTGFEWYL